MVVKPDTVSNRALIKPGMTPDKIKGRVPNRDSNTQDRATTARPSRACTSFDAGCLSAIGKPSVTSARMGTPKTSSACSLCSRDTKKEGNISAASRTISLLKRFWTNRQFMAGP